MHFLMELMHKIPAGWPRWIILITIALVYFLFPEILKKLLRDRLENQLVAQTTQFLQMKKLYFEIQALKKDKDLPDVEFPGEKRLQTKLNELYAKAEKPKLKITYSQRLKYTLIGAATFFAITTLIFIILGHLHTASASQAAKSILLDLVLYAACGIVASFIPTRTHSVSFLYGLTMPIPLVVFYLILMN